MWIGFYPVKLFCLPSVAPVGVATGTSNAQHLRRQHLERAAWKPVLFPSHLCPTMMAATSLHLRDNDQHQTEVILD